MKGSEYMAYYGSTDPKTVAGPAGVANEYTDFNAINSPTINSTGTFDLTGDATITGDATVTGDAAITGAINHTEGVTAQTVVGTCATPATANITNVGFSILSSSSGDINRYLLAAPTIGARKKIMFNTGLTTANIAYVYACASSLTTVLIGTASSGSIAVKSCGVSPMISLYGLSTSRWIVESYSTASENGGAISLVSSSCS